MAARNSEFGTGQGAGRGESQDSNTEETLLEPVKGADGNLYHAKTGEMLPLDRATEAWQGHRGALPVKKVMFGERQGEGPKVIDAEAGIVEGDTSRDAVKVTQADRDELTRAKNAPLKKPSVLHKEGLAHGQILLDHVREGLQKLDPEHPAVPRLKNAGKHLAKAQALFNSGKAMMMPHALPNGKHGTEEPEGNKHYNEAYTHLTAASQELNHPDVVNAMRNAGNDGLPKTTHDEIVSNAQIASSNVGVLGFQEQGRESNKARLGQKVVTVSDPAVRARVAALETRTAMPVTDTPLTATPAETPVERTRVSVQTNYTNPNDDPNPGEAVRIPTGVTKPRSRRATGGIQKDAIKKAKPKRTRRTSKREQAERTAAGLPATNSWEKGGKDNPMTGETVETAVDSPSGYLGGSRQSTPERDVKIGVTKEGKVTAKADTARLPKPSGKATKDTPRTPRKLTAKQRAQHERFKANKTPAGSTAAANAAKAAERAQKDKEARAIARKAREAEKAAAAPAKREAALKPRMTKVKKPKGK